jgi:hypothetical protein
MVYDSARLRKEERVATCGTTCAEALQFTSKDIPLLCADLYYMI